MAYIDDFNLQFVAAGGPQIGASPDTRDAEVALVHDLVRRARNHAAQAMADIMSVAHDPELSEQGKRTRQVKVGEAALATLSDLVAAEAIREALERRLAAVPVPTLDDIPSAVFPLLYAKLAKTDPVTLLPSARDFMRSGDPLPAIMLASLPPSVSLVSRAQAESLRQELRTQTDSKAAASAAALERAVADLDAAAKASETLIRRAAQLPVTPALVNS